MASLSYFQKKIGPQIYYSFPEKVLDPRFSSRIRNIMDQALGEEFFTYKFEDLNSVNFFFEIDSKWARGGKEMVMLSLIFDKILNLEREKNILALSLDFTEKLKSNEGVYKAFHIHEKNLYDKKEQNEIEENLNLIKVWVQEFYSASFEEIREKTEEESIANLLKDKEVFFTHKKLSEGTITYEELQNWFKENFKKFNFDNILRKLLDQQFIIVTEIRYEKHIILLKDVEIRRLPPESIIRYFDKTPEIIEKVIKKVKKFFDTPYLPTEEDSFILLRLVSDPKIYNVIAKLRDRPILKSALTKFYTEKSLIPLFEILDTLKKYEIIDEFKHNGEVYVILKTDLQITTYFPEYLRKK